MVHTSDADGGYLLPMTLLVTVVFQLGGFAIAYLFQFDKITDLWGSTNFLILAWLSLALGNYWEPRQIVVTSLVTVWGLRLGAFLFVRVLKRGKDERFDEMRAKFWNFLAFWVFQIVWVWTVSLPVVLLNASEFQDPDWTATDIAGFILFGIGLITESVADFSRFRFSQDQSNRGKFIKSGVWSVSRHPNYFGEICVWLGIFLVSSTVYVDNGREWQYVSVLSPVLTYLLLMYVSGVPLAEQRYDKKFAKSQEYWDYKEETSVLVPMPPSVFGKLPHVVKKVFFCEYDFYTTHPSDLDSPDAALNNT